MRTSRSAPAWIFSITLPWRAGSLVDFIIGCASADNSRASATTEGRPVAAKASNGVSVASVHDKNLRGGEFGRERLAALDGVAQGGGDQRTPADLVVGGELALVERVDCSSAAIRFDNASVSPRVCLAARCRGLLRRFGRRDRIVRPRARVANAADNVVQALVERAIFSAVIFMAVSVALMAVSVAGALARTASIFPSRAAICANWSSRFIHETPSQMPSCEQDERRGGGRPQSRAAQDGRHVRGGA